MSKRRDFIERAAAYEGDNCILWPFATTGSGYGTYAFKANGKKTSTTAHRYVLILAKGEPPSPDMHAAHRPNICHNPLCCNVAHLYWATPTENNEDKRSDGTSQYKLTDEQVAAILADPRTQQAIADEYGVTQPFISGLKSRKWRRKVQPAL